MDFVDCMAMGSGGEGTEEVDVELLRINWCKGMLGASSSSKDSRYSVEADPALLCTTVYISQVAY